MLAWLTLVMTMLTQVAQSDEPRLKLPLFEAALYIHPNNEPKYHAMQIRAERFGIVQKLPLVWMTAQDSSDELRYLSNEQREDKRVRWLQRHDQDTGGVPGPMPWSKACL